MKNDRVAQATCAGATSVPRALGRYNKLMDSKERALFDALRDMKSVIVAYSGGADSAYLAWAARQVLGDHAIAITADSASLAESHKRDAEQFSR